MLTTRYILDEAHLKHYDKRLKSWASSQPSKTLPSTLYPWTLTEKAGAVTCWPVGGTELLPTVDFMFTEVPPESGDKGPDNPSTISGVSSIAVGRCGKNLMREQLWTRNDDDMTCVVGADGTVTFNGTAPSYDSFYAYTFNPTLTKTDFPSYIKPGGTYRISASGNSYPNVHFQIYSVSSPTAAWGNTIGYAVAGESKTFTVPNDSIGMLFRYAIGRNVTVSNATLRVQIEEGTVETEYERPIVNDYTLPLNGTYYGGTLDVASGVMTVTHSGMTLNGDTYLSTGIFDEQSDVYGVGFYPDPERLMTLSDSSDAACSILPVAVGTGAKNYPCAYLANNAMGIRLQFSKTSLGLGDGVEASEVRTAVKAFLAQHPGFIVWPVASPAAVQLTPTQILSLAQTDKYTPRLNTIYTDASSVQVGYVKSPIREEYELKQAIVAQGGNI